MQCSESSYHCYWLFLLVTRQSINSKRTGLQQISSRSLDDWEYADDLTLLSFSQPHTSLKAAVVSVTLCIYKTTYLLCAPTAMTCGFRDAMKSLNLCNSFSCYNTTHIHTSHIMAQSSYNTTHIHTFTYHGTEQLQYHTHTHVHISRHRVVTIPHTYTYHGTE